MSVERKRNESNERGTKEREACAVRENEEKSVCAVCTVSSGCTKEKSKRKVHI